MARKRPIRGANSDRWIRRQEATRQAGVLPSRHAGIRRGSDETDRPSLGGARFGYRTSGIAFETGHPAATLNGFRHLNLMTALRGNKETEDRAPMCWGAVHALTIA
jgi:hypothetical protein